MKEIFILNRTRKELDTMCKNLKVSKVGSREVINSRLLAFPYSKLKAAVTIAS